ncbi:hypothetical protein INT43_004946 [Umbelopsis isabellina]|uniref:Uncharacterized protein n=1 Tax=Mortierella isabellina TaxID=91625 RepID=A0A8H7UAD4_MORIS|nr:hypothetical protein INT43_004946 [Umbelopsis isabellina]
MELEQVFSQYNSKYISDCPERLCDKHEEAKSILQRTNFDYARVEKLKAVLGPSEWKAVAILFDEGDGVPADKVMDVLRKREQASNFQFPQDEDLFRRHFAIIYMFVVALRLNPITRFTVVVLLLEKYYCWRSLKNKALESQIGRVLTKLLDIETDSKFKFFDKCKINVYSNIEYHDDTFTTIYAVYALLFAVGRKRASYCPRQGLRILNPKTIVRIKFQDQGSEVNWFDTIRNGMNNDIRRGYMRNQGATVVKLMESSSVIISFRNRHIYSILNTTVSNGRIESTTRWYPVIYTLLVGLSISVPAVAEFKNQTLSARNIDALSTIFSLLVISSTILPIIAAIVGDTFTWSRLITGKICPRILEIDSLSCVVCELSALTEQYDANELFGTINTCAVTHQPRGNTSFSRPLFAYEAQLLGLLLLYDPTRQVYCAYDDRTDHMRVVLKGLEGNESKAYDYHVTAASPGLTSQLMCCDANRLLIG